jgi:hypothetical protein
LKIDHQTERVVGAAMLVIVATAFVLLNHFTGEQWISFVQWVIGFVLAHHVATSAAQAVAARGTAATS